ncbi:MAG: HAD-IA family hydrolase [Clostridia bacterium]|nr:HAD-IA family hydrolase [Clostridia bacterium]
MAEFDYVIFDFDGTVADTGEGILKSLQYSFTAMGDPEPDLSDLKKFIGPPVYYSYTTFYGVSEDKVDLYVKKYRERYSEKGIYESKVYDGMIELINALKENNIKVGIASSKPERLIYAVADYLEITDMFDAIVGVKSDNSKHSSKAGLITQAMEEMGATDKDKVLMVGDRMFDIDGAHEAGIKCCGALWGFGNEEEFRAHNAKFIVSTPLEIIKLVK